MAKKDKLKANLIIFNSLLITFLTALFAVLSFTYIHFKNFQNADFIIIRLALLFLILCLLYIFKNIKECLNRLEKES